MDASASALSPCDNCVGEGCSPLDMASIESFVVRDGREGWLDTAEVMMGNELPVIAFEVNESELERRREEDKV